jgi:predicted site-specific integrase-resolvase
MTATLTPAEVAAHLRVTSSFVYRHWRELGGAKLGDSQTSRLRFRPEAIEAYIRKHETPTPARRRVTVNSESNLSHIQRFAAKKRG